MYNYTLQGNCNGGVCNYAGGANILEGGCKYTFKGGLYAVQGVHKTRRSKLTWSEMVIFDRAEKKAKKSSKHKLFALDVTLAYN